MANLQTLKNQKKNIKCRFTQFKNFVDKINSDEPSVQPKELELRISKVESILDSIYDIQSQIEALDSEVDSEVLNEETLDFENNYFYYLAKAKTYLEDTLQNAIGDDQISNRSSQNSQFSPPNVKLPPIPLPNFDGSYDQWLFYKDTFKSLIHDNQSIPNVQKFHYLRLSLKGQAAELLKALESSADNYSIAWDLLVKRFENPKILITNHIKALFELEAVKSECYRSLRNLLDGLNKHLRALEVLKQPVDSWDALVIHMISLKLDQITRRDWEIEYSKHDTVTLKFFTDFLHEKCRLLETLQLNQQKNKRHSFAVTHSPICSFCEKDHTVYNCKLFLSFNVDKRVAEATKRKWCLNCLRNNHQTNQCRSPPCRKCNKRHNTLLHNNYYTGSQINQNPTSNPITTLETLNTSVTNNSRRPSATSNSDVSTSTSAPRPSNISTMVAAASTNLGEDRVDSNSSDLQQTFCNSRAIPRVLLSTAMVDILDRQGSVHSCRVLLDCGSESSFITEELCHKLGLQTKETNISVSGIGLTNSKIIKQTMVTIQARQNSFECNLKCLVIPKITNKIPYLPVNVSHLKIPSNIILADPSFYEPRAIDILIGCDKFWDLLTMGQIKLGKNLPIIQKTQLGWVISGNVSYDEVYSISCNFSTAKPLDQELTRFWEIEEKSNVSIPLSLDDRKCEDNFKTTTTRNRDGRFIVSLPLRHPVSMLGDSLQSAKNRFLNLEKKLQRNPDLKIEYSKFIDEYESLGHMTETKFDTIKSNTSFFLPHHCVLNNASSTTKLRVVFDGSSKSSSGYSLNDILLVGPTVQDDLLSILLRSRTHNILLTGDIAKMYRQVLVNEEQRHLQMILWRSDPSLEIRPYFLNTVTYGTGPAAYLATRCLKELSLELSETNPLISKIISRDFYVDDLSTGGSTIEEVKLIKEEVTNVLNSAGFELRKFHCNEPKVLSDSTNSSSNNVYFGDNPQLKTLGLYWEPKDDILKYHIQTPSNNRFTKRNILSCIAQIFDPLGLIAPVVITAKIIIQRLWQHKLAWDESLPLELTLKWRNFQEQLIDLNDLKVPRQVLLKTSASIQLHGFSDASEQGYGSCIFLRSTDSGGNIFSSVLCAKTRVAPLKTTTIPRLELCAALLLAELMNKVLHSLEISVDKIYLWSDSMIVLSWIRSESQQFKIFVANRIAQIHELTNADNWHYVKTGENPADLLSRGTSPGFLISSELWWTGPPWLSLPENNWPSYSPNIISTLDLPEKRTNSTASTLTLTATVVELDIFNRFSSFRTLQRVMAYCLRFINNCKISKNERQGGNLGVRELNASLITLLKMVQNSEFEQEIHDLTNSKQLSSKGKLLQLNPFIDEQGILRVGGRLRNSDFSYDKKYPAILPTKHRFTILLMEHEHLRLLHAGPQMLLASIRRRFWPISGRNLVRKVVRSCTKCFRYDASAIQHVMGDLPSLRLKPNRPFLACGVDYLGPVPVKDRLTRNYKTVKGWVCLFVCLSTRAIHLEIVGDLSTNSFLACLRRFFARRGMSSDIYSDHGTNFIGAKNEIYKFFEKESSNIQLKLSQDGIKWHLIPPRSPHFGGLWEAGVKSTKFHLKRVIGSTPLTFEEYYTVLTQIEACLNSRPISPLSTDPSDPQPLTPAHFLIGEELTSLPDEDYLNVPEGRLTKFKRLQKMIQHFWTRWSKEYISELQQRTKWKQNFPTILKPGCVVLVKEDGLPPLKWQMGVVQEIHPGSDGVVRAATIRTSTSVVKRPAVKLCILPTSDV